MNVTGTDGNDFLIGTEEDDEIVGKLGNDRLEGRGGNDWLAAGPGSDTVYGDEGSDIIIVEADGDHDLIRGFTSGEDTIVFRNFGDIDSFADLEPFMTLRASSVVELDMSAAVGGVAGDEVLNIRYTNAPPGPDDVSFESFPDIDPSATVTPVDPRFRPDPDLYDLKEPEVPTLVEHGFTTEGPYIQPFEDPMWGGLR